MYYNVYYTHIYDKVVEIRKYARVGIYRIYFITIGFRFFSPRSIRFYYESFRKSGEKKRKNDVVLVAVRVVGWFRFCARRTPRVSYVEMISRRRRRRRKKSNVRNRRAYLFYVFLLSSAWFVFGLCFFSSDDKRVLLCTVFVYNAARQLYWEYRLTNKSKTVRGIFSCIPTVRRGEFE